MTSMTSMTSMTRIGNDSINLILIECFKKCKPYMLYWCWGRLVFEFHRVIKNKNGMKYNTSMKKTENDRIHNNS